MMYIRYEMLQVSFHPLVVGTYLCNSALLETKETIGFKRETPWYQLLKMGKTFLLAEIIKGKSTQDQVLTQGEGFILLIVFIRLSVGQWSVSFYYVQDEELHQRLPLQNPPCLQH